MEEEQVSFFESKGWQTGSRLLANLAYGIGCLGLLFHLLHWPGWKEMIIQSVGTLFVVLVAQAIAEASLRPTGRPNMTKLGRLRSFIIPMSIGWILMSSMFATLKMPGAESVGQIALSLSISAGLLWFIDSREANGPLWRNRQPFVQQVLLPVLLSAAIWIIGSVQEPHWLTAFFSR